MTVSKGIGRGKRPESKKALEPTKWPKGYCPNPSGRPKGSLSLKDRMQPFLDLDIKVKMPDGTTKDKTIMESIIMSLLAQAQKGNIMAIREVLDRNFGKEPENVNINTHEDWLQLEKEKNER